VHKGDDDDDDNDNKTKKKKKKQKWGERIFSSQQLDRRVSIRIVMIMGLD